VIRQVERQSAVAVAEGLDADPHHLASGDQQIEVPGAVAFDARREDVGLEHRRRDRGALQLLDGIEQGIEAGARPCHAVPRDGQPAEGVGVDGLDLLPQPRERALPHRAQHAGLAPLLVRAARAERALDDTPRRGEALQRAVDGRAAQPEPLRALVGRERQVRARIAEDEIAERIAHRLQQRLGESRRQRGAERVAVARRVLDGAEARRAEDRQAHDPPRALERRQRRGHVAQVAARDDLVRGQVAQPQQQIVEGVRRCAR
jgi:hypothetical protein